MTFPVLPCAPLCPLWLTLLCGDRAPSRTHRAQVISSWQGYCFPRVASSVSSDPTVIVISFVQALYPGFSTRKLCFPGPSAIFAGVYPMESPSTNTSDRYGVERTVTVPVEGAGSGGGGGGAGSGAVALSSPALEKPIIDCDDCGPASSSDSRFFSSAVTACIGPAVFRCVICNRKLPVADRKYRESPLTSSFTADPGVPSGGGGSDCAAEIS